MYDISRGSSAAPPAFDTAYILGYLVGHGARLSKGGGRGITSRSRSTNWGGWKIRLSFVHYAEFVEKTHVPVSQRRV